MDIGTYTTIIKDLKNVQLYTYDARRTIVLVISPFPLKDRTYVCVDVK